MTKPQLLSLLSKPHHGGILTGGNMLGNHDGNDNVDDDVDDDNDDVDDDDDDVCIDDENDLPFWFKEYNFLRITCTPLICIVVIHCRQRNS